MTVAVADTNVLASGVVRGNPHAAVVQVLDAWRAGAFTLVLSTAILDELTRTFASPYFRKRLSGEQIERFLRLLRRQAVLTSLTVSVQGVATHPEDDVMLATAVSGQATYLVTGDAQLQNITRYQDVEIVSPRQFLDVLAASGQWRG